ncbi:hypothetical protein P154DRAFT_584695 [Amniculicola lignicola CBS 123094]|uniref:Uncharacterized protein n=1 Tax=Amniculicola lignicola CBS 123094 TaxID=1392246 RepID=A0A6A5X5H8_9PLEO|nr:hypothetical protein P154DRAFT_584695 [Amniculicola lignicola CBS 123094]
MLPNRPPASMRGRSESGSPPAQHVSLLHAPDCQSAGPRALDSRETAAKNVISDGLRRQADFRHVARRGPPQHHRQAGRLHWCWQRSMSAGLETSPPWLGSREASSHRRVARMGNVIVPIKTSGFEAPWPPGDPHQRATSAFPAPHRCPCIVKCGAPARSVGLRRHGQTLRRPVTVDGIQREHTAGTIAEDAEGSA